MQGIRIYEIPACKMVSSGVGMFGEEKLERFDQWFSTLPRGIFPRDFLFWDAAAGGFQWLYQYEEGMQVPSEFQVIDFQGGLYAVATDVDQNTDEAAMAAGVDQFLQAHGLERDLSRPQLGNVITSPRAEKILGFLQMDYYIPVKAKA